MERGLREARTAIESAAGPALRWCSHHRAVTLPSRFQHLLASRILARLARSPASWGAPRAWTPNGMQSEEHFEEEECR